MKKFLFLFSVLLFGSLLPADAQGLSFKLVRFDEVYQYQPDLHEKLNLTSEQMSALEAAEEERKNDPEVAAADQAFHQARGTEGETDAKQKWQDLRWNAQTRYAEKVAATLTEEQKSLISNVEEVYTAVRSEIKSLTEGVTDKNEILEKGREVWVQHSASLWSAAPAPSPASSPAATPATQPATP